MPASSLASCGEHLPADDGVGTRGLEGLGVGAAARVEVHLPPGATPSGWPGEQWSFVPGRCSGSVCFLFLRAVETQGIH